MKNANANMSANRKAPTKIWWKNGMSRLGLIGLAAMLISSPFAVAQLVLDDFSTGYYSKTLKTGLDTNYQTGSMIGGTRETTFVACSPSSKCATLNPYDQPSSFQIKPKTKTTPNILIFNSSYKAQSYVELGYGWPTELNLDLATSYDRIRVSFDGADQVVNFNLTVWSNNGSLWSQTGCNLVDPGLLTPFTVDFPFADFTPGPETPGANFGGLTNMLFEFDAAQGAYNGEDWGVTSFEAIPIGAPAADITCHGLGT